MKNLSTARLSIVLSAGAALIILLVLLYLGIVEHGPSFALIIVIPIATFGLLLPATRYVLNLFVRSQIHPLYRTVHNLSPGQGNSGDKRLSNNTIKEVEGEVLTWAEERRNEVEKLKGLENYRKEFMGNVYHELKTPIFNLQGYILTLLDGGLEDESINRLYLERSVTNINRMITIVEDLETISRLEYDALNLKIEKFNIRQTVEEVFEANEMRADKKNIRLVFSMPKEIPVMARGDRKKIYQVVNNLVINSINYGRTNGRTRVTFTPAGKKILVEIEDNGIGIAEEDLPRVFERFYRVDKSRSRDSGGTGLGLAIVKHIIEAHRQSINVKSTPGKGSVFSFTLEKG